MVVAMFDERELEQEIAQRVHELTPEQRAQVLVYIENLSRQLSGQEALRALETIDFSDKDMAEITKAIYGMRMVPELRLEEMDFDADFST
jgi:ribulose 1,5-bisphosphate carboxylase large subunit-like protein